MKKKYIHCTVQVNASDISRRNIDGVEHVTIKSMTLPDNIVMNGILYPAEEIAKSFKGLEGTLAPLEHPVNANGEFLSANSPTAIHDFHVGAFNENVEQVNGRIKIDKTINVPFAMKSDKGKRVMDRINELETSPNPRPIHTSTGVFILDPKFLKAPQVNAEGQEYSIIARNMVFDHDAILLDSVGAAQPHQGVGIGVNAKGQKFDTEFFVLNTEKPPTPNNTEDENMKKLILNALKEAKVPTDGLSDDQLFAEFNKLTANSGESEEIKTLKAEIKANADDKAKAETEAKANAEGGEGGDPKIEDVVANAMKPLLEQITTLTAVVNKTGDEEKGKLVEIVGNHDQYKVIGKDELKKLDVSTLQTMAANCAPSYGVNGHMANNNGVDEKFTAPTDAPE